jgi:hypothetical protein
MLRLQPFRRLFEQISARTQHLAGKGTCDRTMLGIQTGDNGRRSLGGAVDSLDQVVNDAVAGRDAAFGEAGGEDRGQDRIVRCLHGDDPDGVQAAPEVGHLDVPAARRRPRHHQKRAAILLGQVDQVKQGLVVGVLGDVEQDRAAFQL